jgi:hypothetical protein
LANQAGFAEGKEATITGVDFSINENFVKLRDFDEGS